MSKHYEFPGGIDILPGKQGEPVTPGGLRLVSIGGVLCTTTDGVNFSPLASSALATPTTAGLMSAAQAASLANTAGGVIPAAFESAALDLTATSTGNIIVPAVAGKQFVLCNRVSIQFRTATSAGSISTAPTTRVLNGANTWVAAASFPLTTQFAGQGAATGSAPTASLVNTAVTVDVTVGATGTGGFAWTGVFVALGYYV